VPGLLVIMGSGETAPTMVKPHRAIFARAGDRPAALLDTPYGFQENADDISSKAVGYFAASVGRQVDVIGWRTAPPPGLERERALATLNSAGWVFAGPGSPTYAIRQWHGTPLPEAFVDALQRDAVVVFASAAALTLGSHTVPVYEIYKAGAEPHWVPGLGLVERVTGLPVVVIPHYDNAEGGHHDTRFCYLGERRLSRLESELPDEAFIIGVDEHTAVQLDLATRVVTVVGNGRMTVRRQGWSTAYPSGSAIDFDTLAKVAAAGPGSPADALTGITDAALVDMADSGSGLPIAPGLAVPASSAVPAGLTPSAGLAAPASSAVPASLRSAAEAAEARFDESLARRDVDGCVTAILELEQAQLDWATDTLTSDEGERARAALRRMVLRLGELATIGARDPHDVLGPYVETILELRRRTRAGRDFATADWIRDRLDEAGVEVRDTPDGVTWQLR
jgi:cyanophycinase-like exopeptidase